MADLLRVFAGEDSSNHAEEKTPLVAFPVDIDDDVDDEACEKNHRQLHHHGDRLAPSSSLEESSSSSSSSNHYYPLLLRSASSSVLSTFSDDSGSLESLRSGLLIVFIGGIILGIVMPKNLDLATTKFGYQTISSILGYTYFLSWSISFYPQVMTNYKRSSTIGLSNDFSVINHFGYICYSIYNACLFWNTSIQDEYHTRYGPDSKITVQSNDVAFALHGLVLSFVWIIQIYYYNNGIIQLSIWTINFFLCAILVLVSYGIFHLLLSMTQQQRKFSWLDVLYILSMTKVVITITKYVPQVLMNFQRKSTKGWSVWNVTLDVTGGTLSLLQLILDSYALLGGVDFWSGITGNLAKLGVAFVTIVFDIIFLLQHYIWYPPDSK